MEKRIKQEFEGKYGKYVVTHNGIDMLKKSGELINISTTPCILLVTGYNEFDTLKYKLCFKDPLGNKHELWKTGIDLLTIPGIKKLIKAGINFDTKHTRFATDFFKAFMHTNINNMFEE